jgi:asparagine synthase (glutamine-hydrolysing)
MLVRMCHYPWLQHHSFSRDPDGVWAGCVRHAGSARGEAFVSDSLVAVWDGEVFNAEVERRRLEARGTVFETSNTAELIARGWQAEGESFLRRLNGMFSLVICNPSSRELIVITDRFGLKPLFYVSVPGTFAVATELKSLLGLPGIARDWSEQGVGEFFAFGHFFSDRTLFEGVRQVPPATVLRVRGGLVPEITTYWTPAARAASESAGEQISRLDDALYAAVQMRARPGERLGISLSGGLDARTILGLVPPGVDLHSVCIGIEGGIDHRTAAELARLASVPHHAYLLGAGVLRNFEKNLREMVRLTDGHYLDQGIVMPSMATYRDLGIETLLRGHAGELLHMAKAYSFSLDDEAVRASAPALEAWLQRRLTAYMLDGVPRDIFVPDVPAIARASLADALRRTSGGAAPVDRVWPLFLLTRIHRETALSMHMFGTFAPVRMPFLDNEVVDVLLSMPASLKLGDRLQTEILRRRRPEFLRVVNANTGAPVGAGPLRARAATLAMRIAAKLGVKGYQPYERLGLWLRQELRPMVDRVLLGERFLERGIFRPDSVRRVVAEHMNGANHTFLLMSMVCFELGQQMLEEPVESAGAAAS